MRKDWRVELNKEDVVEHKNKINIQPVFNSFYSVQMRMTGQWATNNPRFLKIYINNIHINWSNFLINLFLSGWIYLYVCFVS